MIHKVVTRVPVHSRWHLALKTIPFVLLVMAVKYAAHIYGYEVLPLSSLFTAVISATIFLISILVSGTLVDYKESEKLPGDLAASIEAMADEGLIILKNKKSTEAKAYLQKIIQFNKALIDWFHHRETTDDLFTKLRSFNDDFLVLESQTQANFIARLKQEQNNLRRMITRIHTIRETDFLGTAYAIAEIISSVLITGLIIIHMESFWESLFFAGFVSFILIYMINFIKDLDNPFGYADETNLVEDVSLMPLESSLKRLQAEVKG